MNRQQVLVRVAAVLLTSCLAGGVLGQPGDAFDGEHRATVDGAGLDLSRARDAEILYGRIRSAAHSVCRAQKGLWDGKSVQHQRLCIDRAVDEAVARVDEPLLTALHRASIERVAGR
ncbi:MAG TPA: UrcA family protein [Gammaproteobacteria bacterium]|nr:UrcA family protein [Gammaproteobacteria bacterium]